MINSPAFYDCIVHTVCTSGDARFVYNDAPFVLEVNDIAVFSSPGLVRNISLSEDFSCEFIAAPDNWLHSLLPANNYSLVGGISLFSNPIIKVSEANAERFIQDLRNIHYRLGDVDHSFFEGMMGGLLQCMIYDLFYFHSLSNENILTSDRVGFFSRRFFSMLWAGMPKTQREVSFYAAKLNVTPKYLSETIKRVSGRSISNHINRIATGYIKELLDDDTLSISQIAEEMKFSSVSYFSRYCRKHLGMSPRQYRTVMKTANSETNLAEQ